MNVSRRDFVSGTLASVAIAVVGADMSHATAATEVFAKGTPETVAHLVMAHVDYPDDDARMWAGRIHAYTVSLARLLVWRRDNQRVALDARSFRRHVKFRSFLALVRDPAIPEAERRKALNGASCGFGADLDEQTSSKEVTVLYFGNIVRHLAPALEKIARAETVQDSQGETP